MKNLLRLAAIFFLLLAGCPVRAGLAQTSTSPIIEPCDQRSALGWSAGRKTRYENGVCVFNKAASLQPDQVSFTDYDLSFRVRLKNGSALSLSYRLEVSADRAQMERIQRYGNASSTENITNLGSRQISLPLDQWVNLRISLRDTTFSLYQSNSIIKDWKVDRITSGGFTLRSSGSSEFLLDDITLLPINSAVTSNHVASMTSEVINSWIAFQRNGNKIWIVHPDGSGLRQVTANPKTQSHTLEIAPPGNMLSFLESSGETFRLRLLTLPDLVARESGEIPNRSGIYSWSPDGSRVATYVQAQQNGGYRIRILDVQTGQTVREYPFPAQIDGTRLEYLYVNQLSWSPVKDELLLKLSFNEKNQQAVNRVMLMNLSNGQLTRLPIAGEANWAPDGSALVSNEGGWLDLTTMIFYEFDAKLGKYVSYVEPIWSPNGQFIALFGKEQLAMIEASTQNIILSIPISSKIDISWSPDSHYFAYSEGGRIFVQDILTKKEQQIAEGYGPVWQPVPALAKGMVLQPTEPAATPTPAQQKPATTSAPARSRNARTPTTASPPGKEPGPSSRSAAPILSAFLLPGILTGLIGAGLLLAMLLLPRFPRSVKCPNCAGQVSSRDTFCMYCGAAVATASKPSISPGITRSRFGWIAGGIALLLGGCMVGIALVSMVVGPAKPAHQIVPPATEVGARPDRTEQPVPTKVQQPSPGGTIPAAVALSGSLMCADLPVNTTPLYEILGMIRDNSQEGLMERLSKLPTQEQNSENFEKILNQFCSLSKLAVSPDGQKIAVLGFGANKVWLAIYETISLKPINAYEATETFGHLIWSPDSSRVAYEHRDGISISPTARGGGMITIPASMRVSQSCKVDVWPPSFQWLPDSQKIVRKVNSAIEVIDATSGEKVRDIPTDDSLMAVISSDSHRCVYRAVFSPDGSKFATYTVTLDEYYRQNNNKINIWDSYTGEKILELENSNQVLHLFWSPDGEILFRESIITGTPLIAYHLSGDRLARQVSVPGREDQFFTDFLWAPDQARFIVESEKTSFLCDAGTLACSGLPGGPNNAQMEPATWLPDGRRSLWLAKSQPQVYYVLDPQSGQWTELSQMRSLR